MNRWPDSHYATDKGNLFLYPDIFSKYMSLKELFNFRQNWGLGLQKCRDLFRAICCQRRYEKVVHVNATSSINAPSDLFDRYGRVIADIHIQEAKNTLNHWLVEEGWALQNPMILCQMTKYQI